MGPSGTQGRGLGCSENLDKFCAIIVCLTDHQPSTTVYLLRIVNHIDCAAIVVSVESACLGTYRYLQQIHSASSSTRRGGRTSYKCRWRVAGGWNTTASGRAHAFRPGATKADFAARIFEQIKGFRQLRFRPAPSFALLTCSC